MRVSLFPLLGISLLWQKGYWTICFDSTHTHTARDLLALPRALRNLSQLKAFLLGRWIITCKQHKHWDDKTEGWGRNTDTIHFVTGVIFWMSVLDIFTHTHYILVAFIGKKCFRWPFWVIILYIAIISSYILHTHRASVMGVVNSRV